MKKSMEIVIIVVVMGVVLIIGGIYFLGSGGSVKVDLAGKNSNQSKNQTSVNDAGPVKIQESATRSAVPENIKIPDVGEKTTIEVAVPATVSAAAPGVAAKFRGFDIKGDKGVFSPSTVIVQLGDTVHINFLAVDKDYDITFPDYGMKQTAKKGESKVLEFQSVVEGKFAFYCEACGGLEGMAKGYIIVAPKN